MVVGLLGVRFWSLVLWHLELMDVGGVGFRAGVGIACFGLFCGCLEVQGGALGIM